MYFDHIKCSSCGSRFSPEQIAGGRYEQPKCPSCGAPISQKDLFGVADHWVGVDDDSGNDMSLDDLLPGAPPPRAAPPPAQRHPAASAPRRAMPEARPEDRAIARRTERPATSARDILRDMKRKK